MKVNFISIFTLSTLFAGALSVPTAEVETRAIQKRAAIDQAYSIVQGLYTEVQTYTGALNATAKSVSSSSSASQKSAAVASAGASITSITKAINAATAQIKAIPKKRDLLKRQADATALATLVFDLILDISGALNNIIATLGLTSLLSFLTPLVASLSGLLLSLEVVVNNLLALVQQLVDGLLTGLSVGLAGITL